jgi:predicted deacetylase
MRIPSPAQFLLRFDDLCPTMQQNQWKRLLPVMEELGIRPILAVVPDNQDCELQQKPADPEFWAGMRALESAGATTALHGFRHLCRCKGKSLVPLHERSEFAGVDEHRQRQWIRTGLTMLREHGLHPTVWVAPRHGFDLATLRALKAEGIRVLSDGLTRLPFLRGGMIWIPQQLWGPEEKQHGIWTICTHCNSARNAEVDALIAFMRRNASSFTSVDRVLAEFEARELDGGERIYEQLSLLRIQASRLKKRILRRASPSRVGQG